MDAITEAVKNRTVRGSVLITHVGRTSERDALPQAADYLATLEGVETAIVFGIIEDAIEVSGRSMTRGYTSRTLSTTPSKASGALVVTATWAGARCPGEYSRTTRPTTYASSKSPHG